jgi:ATP-binding cassette subfamily B protein
MAQTGEALEALARACRMPVRAGGFGAAPPDHFAADPLETQTRWLESAAAALGLEVEAASAAYGEVDRLVRGAAPALLRVADGRVPGLLALYAANRHTASLVAPDRSVRRVRIASIRAELCEPLEATLRPETDKLLDAAGVNPARRPHVRAAIVREQLAGTTVTSCWLVRLPPGASIRAQGSNAHLWPRLTALVLVHVIAYSLWILSWWIVGRGALEGHLDRSWLLAWALLLVTLIPFELMMTWLQGRLSIDAGALLKRRLLQGALRLEPEELRHEGAGQLLGRVIESQAIEALALSGGFLALVAVLELGMAAVVLGAAAVWLPMLLAACAAVTVAIGWRFFGRRQRWTLSRLAMTHDLVERMVGHRTRLAQEARVAWHEGEDQALEPYLDASREMDRAAVWLVAFTPRSWLLAGVLGLSPLFISGSAPAATLAVALGGILLAHRAFRRLAPGVSHLAGAAIAWTQAALVFAAAARPRSIGSPGFAVVPKPTGASDGDALVDGHDLSFRYQGRGEPVLRGCNLCVRRGERLLLHGPSGGGKSTLASLLTGLRVPESGVLLLEGVDRQTLGADLWRRRIIAVPQFHENHVLMGTFAFNLLMGAEWPPRAADLERAEALCRELGLGDLLERMPAGLLQQVGETGWQLSHRERSRLFIARALLQDADFLVLDESFAQLDPENLRRALATVLNHSPTVMVIAHP